MFKELQAIFQNTRVQKGVALPLDYMKLDGILSDEEENKNLSIAKSQTSDSFLEYTALAYMVETRKISWR